MLNVSPDFWYLKGQTVLRMVMKLWLSETEIYCRKSNRHKLLSGQFNHQMSLDPSHIRAHAQRVSDHNIVTVVYMSECSCQKVYVAKLQWNYNKNVTLPVLSLRSFQQGRSSREAFQCLCELKLHCTKEGNFGCFHTLCLTASKEGRNFKSHWMWLCH